MAKKRVQRVVLSGVISEDSVGETLYELFQIERRKNIDRAELWLTTPGGNVESGFALIDAIQQMDIPVDIVASGACMSMGALILQAGDRRYATPNTRLMIHPMSSGFYGHAEEGKVELKEIESVEKMSHEHMARRVGMSVKKFINFQGRLRYMSPEEAKKFNFIDGIRRSSKR